MGGIKMNIEENNNPINIYLGKGYHLNFIHSNDNFIKISLFNNKGELKYRILPVDEINPVDFLLDGRKNNFKSLIQSLYDVGKTNKTLEDVKIEMYEKVAPLVNEIKENVINVKKTTKNERHIYIYLKTKKPKL